MNTNKYILPKRRGNYLGEGGFNMDAVGGMAGAIIPDVMETVDTWFNKVDPNKYDNSVNASTKSDLAAQVLSHKNPLDNLTNPRSGRARGEVFMSGLLNSGRGFQGGMSTGNPLVGGIFASVSGTLGHINKFKNQRKEWNAAKKANNIFAQNVMAENTRLNELDQASFLRNQDNYYPNYGAYGGYMPPIVSQGGTGYNQFLLDRSSINKNLYNKGGIVSQQINTNKPPTSRPVSPMLSSSDIPFSYLDALLMSSRDKPTKRYQNWKESTMKDLRDNQTAERLKLLENYKPHIPYNPMDHSRAMGGALSNGYGFLNMPNALTTFNVGGTHEENPNQGIMQGIGENGEPNFVEEGETKWNDYIFSNRMKPGKEELEKFLLPKNLKNKTFAEASKKLNEESEERELDLISQRGRDTSLAKLMITQETMKEDTNNLFSKGGKLHRIGKLSEGNPELNAGIRVEMEHTNSPKKAKKIAQDHLKEKSDYYTQLVGTGIADESMPKELTNILMNKFGAIGQGMQQQMAMGGNLFQKGGKTDTIKNIDIRHQDITNKFFNNPEIFQAWLNLKEEDRDAKYREFIKDSLTKEGKYNEEVANYVNTLDMPGGIKEYLNSRQYNNNKYNVSYNDYIELTGRLEKAGFNKEDAKTQALKISKEISNKTKNIKDNVLKEKTVQKHIESEFNKIQDYVQDVQDSQNTMFKKIDDSYNKENKRISSITDNIRKTQQILNKNKEADKQKQVKEQWMSNLDKINKGRQSVNNNEVAEINEVTNRPKAITLEEAKEKMKDAWNSPERFGKLGDVLGINPKSVQESVPTNNREFTGKYGDWRDNIPWMQDNIPDWDPLSTHQPSNNSNTPKQQTVKEYDDAEKKRQAIENIRALRDSGKSKPSTETKPSGTSTGQQRVSTQPKEKKAQVNEKDVVNKLNSPYSTNPTFPAFPKDIAEKAKRESEASLANLKAGREAFEALNAKQQENIRNKADRQGAGFDSNSLLEYAPVLSNLGQYLSTLGKKPETVNPYTVKPQMLYDKMNYNPTDSSYALNNIRQRFAGQDKALQSGALGSSALSNLYMMQSNRDRQAAEYEALRQGENENMNRRNQALAFNADINSRNAQADMQAQMFNNQARERANDINAQNKAALENQRSAFLSGIGTNLGQIGRERRWEEVAMNLGMGYGPKGNWTAKGGKLILPPVRKNKR